MVEVDIESGLTYPLRGDHALAVNAILGGGSVLLNVLMVGSVVAALVVEELSLLLLALVPLQLVVAVGWTGYFVRVVRTTLDGATSPPPLGDWGRLARDGLWGLLVVLAYQVPLAVLTVGGYVLVLGLVFNPEAMSATGVDAGTWGVLGALLMMVVAVVGFVASVVAAYLLPISLAAYAGEGRVRAAFSPGTLTAVGFSAEYAVPWALVAGIYVGVYMFVSLLSAVLVGYLLVPFLPLVYFYLGTSGFHMFAQAYAERTGSAVPGARRSPEASGTGGHGPDDI